MSAFYLSTRVIKFTIDVIYSEHPRVSLRKDVSTRAGKQVLYTIKRAVIIGTTTDTRLKWQVVLTPVRYCMFWKRMKERAL